MERSFLGCCFRPPRALVLRQTAGTNDMNTKEASARHAQFTEQERGNLGAPPQPSLVCEGLIPWSKAQFLRLGASNATTKSPHVLSWDP